MNYLLGLPSPPPHNITLLSHLLPFCSAEEMKMSQGNRCAVSFPLFHFHACFPQVSVPSAPKPLAGCGSPCLWAAAWRHLGR